jgi:UDP-glucose:(heptosyl)LPS alpha-1,3-glucosyltransferase
VSRHWAFLTTRFTTRLGRGRTLVELCRGLAAAGDRVSVHAGYVDQRLRSTRGVEFSAVRFRGSGLGSSLRSFYRTAGKAGRDADLRVAFDPAAGSGVWRASGGCLAEWVELLKGDRELARMTGLRPRSVHRRLLRHEAQLMRNPDVVVVAPSPLVASQLETRFEATGNRCRVLEPGADCERFRPGLREKFLSELRDAWGLEPEHRVLLFVGGAWARRGVDRLLRAMVELKDHHPDLVAVIVGEDPRAPFFVDLAERLGVRSRVLFVGGLEWVEHAYAAADVVVLPTRYSPAALVPLEALASGLPVVTTDADGSARRLRGLDCVRVVDEAQRPWPSCEKLAAAITELLDPGAFPARGQAARAWAQEHGTDWQLRAWQQLGEELASGTAGGETQGG